MQAVFDFFEAKEAVEVIEASDVIMSVEVIGAADVLKTTYILEINKLMTRITLFWCFEKEKILTKWWNFKWNSASFRIEAVEDRNVIFNQIQGS